MFDVSKAVGLLSMRGTMYRLVLSCLGGLAAVALIGSLTGVVAYSAPALLVSLATALVVSYASNRLIAAMYQVTPHSESTLITGYLIFFIFPPSTNLVPVLGIALAAVLASASKYLLAFRGRHIFNPAAAGAFLLTLTGFYFSAWWAGNPVMLPVALLAAVLILHRTRRIAMGLTFIVASGAVMVLRSLLDGQTIISALTWPLTSSPIIFFAAFMLTEPLTQPPLKWQQIGFAAVVGVLFSVPLHLGPLYLAPESALLIGNLLAFMAGQRRSIVLVLRRSTLLTPTTSEFSFHPSRSLKFSPGQYLELTLPHKRSDNRGLRRVFSIASPPKDGRELTISTKIPDQASTFKQALMDLPTGTVLTATTIAGDFLLPTNIRSPLLLVAGGIGITPFASQLAEIPAGSRDIVLLYSVSSEDEIAYRRILVDSAVRVILICADPIRALPPHWTSVECSRVTEEIIQNCIPDISSRQVMISGPPAMVQGISATARKLKAVSVRTDYFSGY